MSKPRTAGSAVGNADPDCGDFVTIDHVHSYLHRGLSFVVTSVVPMTAGSNFYCALTPDGAEIHMAMLCSVSGNGITVTLSEAASITGGTPVAPINRDRGSSNTSTVAFVHTPTVNTLGNTLITFHLAAGVQSGTRERSTEEMVLKSNTTYLITITVDAGTAATFSGRMDWYEVHD